MVVMGSGCQELLIMHEPYRFDLFVPIGMMTDSSFRLHTHMCRFAYEICDDGYRAYPKLLSRCLFYRVGLSGRDPNP